VLWTQFSSYSRCIGLLGSYQSRAVSARDSSLCRPSLPGGYFAAISSICDFRSVSTLLHAFLSISSIHVLSLDGNCVHASWVFGSVVLMGSVQLSHILSSWLSLSVPRRLFMTIETRVGIIWWGHLLECWYLHTSTKHIVITGVNPDRMLN
jgi:hypothetical protein